MLVTTYVIYNVKSILFLSLEKLVTTYVIYNNYANA